MPLWAWTLTSTTDSKSWILSEVAEDVQALRGETKYFSKALSQMLPRKFNTSLDMVFSLNPQADKTAGAGMKIQKGLFISAQGLLQIKVCGNIQLYWNSHSSIQTHQLLTSVLIGNYFTVPSLQQIIFTFVPKKSILVPHKLHQPRAVAWISLGYCKKWVWGKASAVCHIIFFFSGADRTAACYYSAPQEMFSCQKCPEPARD